MLFAQTTAPDPTTWGQYWQTGWILWLSAFCILAIYSYLFKDNPIYRAVVQIFIGLNIGYGVIVNWRDILYPQWWLPMTDGFKAILYDAPGSKWSALWALVGVLGALWYFQLSRKYIWLSRIVIGLTVGIGAGLTFKSQFGQNLPQVVDSFRPLAPSVVRPTPSQRFELPASVVRPVLADPVIFLASNTEVNCIEILRGRLVWQTKINEKPTGSLALDGSNLVVPTAAGSITIDKDSGAIKPAAPGTKPVVAQDPTSCKMNGLVDPQGNEYNAVIAIEGGVPVERKEDGKVVWTGKTEAEAVYSGERYLFATEGKQLQIIDPISGELLHIVPFDSEVGFPSIARMPEPAQDYLVGLVPTNKTVLNGSFVVKDLATSHDAGENYWSIDTKKPIIWTSSLDGVVLTAGPDGGKCYDIPPPTPKNAPVDYFNNWVFIISLLSVMTYFFFSFRQRTAKGVSQFSVIGRWVLMIGFGAIFGNTIMTRMSFLLDRLQFLVDDWLRPLIEFIIR